MKKHSVPIRDNANSKKRKNGQEYDVNDKYSQTNKTSDATSKKETQKYKFTKYVRLNMPRR